MPPRPEPPAPTRSTLAGIAVLGPGAIGGLVAGVLRRTGLPVHVVGRPDAVLALEHRGIPVESDAYGSFVARPSVAATLDRPVELLLVCVKAPQLPAALAEIPRRIEVGSVIPFLNGLEHVPLLRARFGDRVAAGSIARVEAYRDPTGTVHAVGRPRITVSIGHDASTPTRRALTLLRAGRLDVTTVLTPAEALWPKLLRLAPLAAVTAAYGVPCGIARTRHRAVLEAAVSEVGLVAACATRLSPDHATVMRQLERLPDDLRTSLQRDVARGGRGEVDAIVGAVLRAAYRHGISCPTLTLLVEQIEARVRDATPAPSGSIVR